MTGISQRGQCNLQYEVFSNFEEESKFHSNLYGEHIFKELSRSNWMLSDWMLKPNAEPQNTTKLEKLYPWELFRLTRMFR